MRRHITLDLVTLESRFRPKKPDVCLSVLSVLIPVSVDESLGKNRKRGNRPSGGFSNHKQMGEANIVFHARIICSCVTKVLIGLLGP